MVPRGKLTADQRQFLASFGRRFLVVYREFRLLRRTRRAGGREDTREQFYRTIAAEFEQLLSDATTAYLTLYGDKAQRIPARWMQLDPETRDNLIAKLPHTWATRLVEEITWLKHWAFRCTIPADDIFDAPGAEDNYRHFLKRFLARGVRLLRHLGSLRPVLANKQLAIGEAEFPPAHQPPSRSALRAKKRVKLAGTPEGPHIVLGREKRLTEKQFALLTALDAAGERGLNKYQLEGKDFRDVGQARGIGDARGILRRLCRDPDWREVIHFPGARDSGGYWLG